MRTSIPGLASWNAATRVTSHLAASDAVVLTVSSASRAGPLQPRRRLAQFLERLLHRRQVGRRLARQPQLARAPLEQADAELFLQPADLMADGGLGDVQLAGGTGEAEVPGGRLERPQPVQRRQGQRHRNPSCMR